MGAYPIVRESDRNAGIIASAVTMLILFLYLYFTTIFMADPPPRDIPVKTETTIDQLELKDLIVENPGGQGGGTPSNDPLDEPKPQTQQVLTKPKNPRTQTTTGQSTNDNNPFSNNPSSSIQQSNNPFGDGGSGGGRGGGRGGGFGSDEGNHGTGRGGTGDGSGRVRLNDPKVDHIQTDVDVTINLKLTINATGEVISAANIASKTTTTDQRIINQVIAAVKSQVKYSKDLDAGLVLAYLTVKVNAQ
ncbi:MAG: hypothetical protein LW688_00535 [Cryomorphaceae bacterium]|nr:hypothetical protein [Cryomorphaceae bacterium]